MKYLRDNIDMILEEILGSKITQGSSFTTDSDREAWKEYFRRKLLQAFKESIDDELQRMAN